MDTWKQRLIAIGVILIITTGCSIGSSSAGSASHFVYPNSNVTPIGEAKGEVSKLCGILFVNFGSPTGADQQKAIDQALQTSGGDVLINLRTDSKVFLVPMLFSMCSVNVTGTAARMEVGKQALSATNRGTTPMPAPAMAPAPATAPVVAPAAVPVAGGCTNDTQCKGSRVCSAGQCVSP